MPASRDYKWLAGYSLLLELTERLTKRTGHLKELLIDMRRCQLLILFCLFSFFTWALSKYFAARISKEITFDGQLKEFVWMQTSSIT